MRIIRIKLPHAWGEWRTMCAMSDLHLGSTATDVKQLVTDLAEARERDARINIIGDLFDLILPKDHKRYTPGAIIAGLRDRDDVINAAVDYAYRYLEPVADLIDVISLGNHELTCIRFNSVDPVRLLVDRLNQHLAEIGLEHRVAHGGYTGYIQYISDAGSSVTRSYDVLYHHGSGGESAVTKGMIDINRKRANWVYHLFLFGHKHHSFADKEPTMLLSSKGQLQAFESLAVQCGGYRKSYEVLNDDNGLSVVPFEEMASMKPKPIGATFVRWRWTGHKPGRLEQRAEV